MIHPMKINLFAALYLCFTAFCTYGQNANVEGTVELPKATKAPVMVKRYEIVSKAGVLAPNPPVAIVYLEGEFGRGMNRTVQQIVQTNYTFVPALLPIQVGTKVEFPNQDDAFHNIFSYSPAKRFDLGRYRPEDRPVPSQVFDKAGLITLRCDIHEHMRALILVLETPYFVTTGVDGRFKLEGLPEGQFVLKAWLNSNTVLEKRVELKNGEMARVDFTNADRARADSSR
jgi:plastocyanin